jgi:Clostripain family
MRPHVLHDVRPRQNSQWNPEFSSKPAGAAIIDVAMIVALNSSHTRVGKARMKRPHALFAMVVLILSALSITFSSQAKPNKLSSQHSTPQPSATAPEQARSRIAQAASNTWTILVYLHADHNLEESSEIDLTEMEKVGSSQNFNVLAQWDRLSEDGVQRIRVGKSQAESEVLEELPELNSDDPKTLADFVRWGVKAYPASHYGLIIWDHGGQWYGIGGDETTSNATDEDSIMNLGQIQQALQNSLNAVNLKQFDFLAFDTCLMGGLEPLVQLAPYGKILIANPEIDYGDGWEYTADFGYLKTNPGVTMTEFAKKQNANWRAHHNTESSDLNNRAHTIYDTTKVGAISNASKEFSSALLNVWDANEQTLAAVRGRTLEYSMDNEDPHAPHDYVDLGDFAAKLAAQNPALKASSDKLNAAIEASIIAKTFGKNNSDARGLSAWLPSDRSSPPDEQTIQDYLSLPTQASTGWGSFVDRWFGTVNANTQAPIIEIIGQKNLINPNAQSLAKIGFSVNDEDLNAIYATVGQTQGDLVTYYGDLLFKAVNPGKYNATWDGTWPTVSDGTTSNYFPGFYQDTDDTLLYATATYTPPRATQGFEITLVLDASKNQLISALDESGTSAKRIALAAGGTLEFQSLQYNFATDKTNLLPSGVRLTIPAKGLAGLNVTQTRVPNGAYDLIVGAVDWAGNDNSEDITVTIK